MLETNQIIEKDKPVGEILEELTSEYLGKIFDKGGGKLTRLFPALYKFEQFIAKRRIKRFVLKMSCNMNDDDMKNYLGAYRLPNEKVEEFVEKTKQHREYLGRFCELMEEMTHLYGFD